MFRHLVFLKCFFSGIQTPNVLRGQDYISYTLLFHLSHIKWGNFNPAILFSLPYFLVLVWLFVGYSQQYTGFACSKAEGI